MDFSVGKRLQVLDTRPEQLVPGTGPDRASYQVAVQAAQNLVTRGPQRRQPRHRPQRRHRPRGPVQLNPPRRPLICPRRVKSPLNRWNKHPPDQPSSSKQITSISTEIDHTDGNRNTPQGKRDSHQRTLTPRHCD